MSELLSGEWTEPQRKRYLGLKMVEARPAPEPAKLRIERTGSVDCVALDGYEVVYADGYTSWSPKQAFDAAYRRVEGATFSIALEAMRRGQLWARDGWNGRNMWVGVQENEQLDHDVLVMKNVDDKMVVWLASQSDLMADDWYEIGY